MRNTRAVTRRIPYDQQERREKEGEE